MCGRHDIQQQLETPPMGSGQMYSYDIIRLLDFFYAKIFTTTMKAKGEKGHPCLIREFTGKNVTAIQHYEYSSLYHL